MRFGNQKQRKIVPNQVFLDGTDRYEPGVAYTVPFKKALYFERNGWTGGTETEPKIPWYRRFLNG